LFPLQFCDVAALGNQPQEELAKFGYNSQNKVYKSSRILLYFGKLLEAICLKYGKFRKNIPQILATLGHHTLGQ
jgi:hypothetical protein